MKKRLYRIQVTASIPVDAMVPSSKEVSEIMELAMATLGLDPISQRVESKEIEE